MIEMSSSEAENYCTSRGYRLVEIYDQDQQDFLHEYISLASSYGQLGSEPENGYWIGLKRTGLSTWKWLDSGLTPEYNAWKSPNQPSNGNADILATMYPEHDYKWVDLDGDGSHSHRNCRPICQKIQGMRFEYTHLDLGL